MYVISADQRNSRDSEDLVDEQRTTINAEFGRTLTLPADRNAGDEIQILTADAATVIDITLRLARTEQWSIGIGVGGAREPLPAEIREATGPAFIAAREAVTEAKKRQTRCAIRAADDTGEWPSAQDAQALLDPLLELLAKRSEAGWELHDELRTVETQSEAARALGITPAAASDRARAGALKIERETRPALVRLLEAVDRTTETNR